MNDVRRKVLIGVVDNLGIIQGELMAVTEDEREALDNLPENIQSGRKGQAMNDAINVLDEAIDNIEIVADDLMYLVNKKQREELS